MIKKLNSLERWFLKNEFKSEAHSLFLLKAATSLESASERLDQRVLDKIINKTFWTAEGVTADKFLEKKRVNRAEFKGVLGVLLLSLIPKDIDPSDRGLVLTWLINLASKEASNGWQEESTYNNTGHLQTTEFGTRLALTAYLIVTSRHQHPPVYNEAFLGEYTEAADAHLNGTLTQEQVLFNERIRRDLWLRANHRAASRATEWFDTVISEIETYLGYKHLMKNKDLLTIGSLSDLKDEVSGAREAIAKYNDSHGVSEVEDGITFLRGGLEKDESGRPLSWYSVRIDDERLVETEEGEIVGEAAQIGGSELMEWMEQNNVNSNAIGKGSWLYEALFEKVLLKAASKHDAANTFLDLLSSTSKKDPNFLEPIRSHLEVIRDSHALLHEDGYAIAEIHNKAAACALGKQTSWCTASPGLDFFDSYYSKEDPLYFFYDYYQDEIYQFSYGRRDFATRENIQASNAIKKDLHLLLLETGVGDKNENVKKATLDMLLGRGSELPEGITGEEIQRVLAPDGDIDLKKFKQYARSNGDFRHQLLKLIKHSEVPEFIRDASVIEYAASYPSSFFSNNVYEGSSASVRDEAIKAGAMAYRDLEPEEAMHFFSDIITPEGTHLYELFPDISDEIAEVAAEGGRSFLSSGLYNIFPKYVEVALDSMIKRIENNQKNSPLRNLDSIGRKMPDLISNTKGVGEDLKQRLSRLIADHDINTFFTYGLHRVYPDILLEPHSFRPEYSILEYFSTTGEYWTTGTYSEYPEISRNIVKDMAPKEFFQIHMRNKFMGPFFFHLEYPELAEEKALMLAKHQGNSFLRAKLWEEYPEAGRELAVSEAHNNPGRFITTDLYTTYPELIPVIIEGAKGNKMSQLKGLFTGEVEPIHWLTEHEHDPRAKFIRHLSAHGYFSDHGKPKPQGEPYEEGLLSEEEISAEEGPINMYGIVEEPR